MFEVLKVLEVMTHIVCSMWHTAWLGPSPPTPWSYLYSAPGWVSVLGSALSRGCAAGRLPLAAARALALASAPATTASAEAAPVPQAR